MPAHAHPISSSRHSASFKLLHITTHVKIGWGGGGKRYNMTIVLRNEFFTLSVTQLVNTGSRLILYLTK